MDQYLRNDLKDLWFFIMNSVVFSVEKDIVHRNKAKKKEKTNQPPRPGINSCSNI